MTAAIIHYYYPECFHFFSPKIRCGRKQVKIVNLTSPNPQLPCSPEHFFPFLRLRGICNYFFLPLYRSPPGFSRRANAFLRGVQLALLIGVHAPLCVIFCKNFAAILNHLPSLTFPRPHPNTISARTRKTKANRCSTRRSTDDSQDIADTSPKTLHPPPVPVLVENP